MNYRTHIVSSLSEIGKAAWDGLLAQQAEANPFLSYAFLHALHESGSASPETGWQPQYIALYDGDTLAAALPLYVKGHSYGEYEYLCRGAPAVRLTDRCTCARASSAISKVPARFLPIQSIPLSD